MLDKLREIASEKFTLMGSVTANYGWIREDGELIPSPAHICHAGLAHPPDGVYNVVAVVSEVMSAQHRSRVPPEIQCKYYHWLMNESPFEGVFITKDYKQVFEDGFILLDASAPRNVVTACCIMSRYLWEETKAPVVWDALVDAGLDKDGAFVLAHVINLSNFSSFDPTDQNVAISMATGNSNHTTFDGQLVKGVLTNYRAHNIVNVDVKPYKEEIGGKGANLRLFTGSKGIGKMFWPTLEYKGRVGFLPTVKKLVYALAKGETTTVSNPSPWCSEPKTITAYKFPAIIEAVAQAYPQILEKDASESPHSSSEPPVQVDVREERLVAG